jgi:hypothetical protein
MFTFIVSKHINRNWDQERITYKSFSKPVKRYPRSASTETSHSFLHWFERWRCINLSSKTHLPNPVIRVFTRSDSMIGSTGPRFGFVSFSHTETWISEKHRKEGMEKKFVKDWSMESRERSIGGNLSNTERVWWLCRGAELPLGSKKGTSCNSVNEMGKEKRKGNAFLFAFFVCVCDCVLSGGWMVVTIVEYSQWKCDT